MPLPRTIQRFARIAALGAALAGAWGCAHKCPAAKGALDDQQSASEDVARVNRMVDKRKAAMAEAAAGGHDTFTMQRLRFSVTGYELAVETQLRVLKVSPKFEGSPLYKEYRGVFDGMRCDFDLLVEDPENHRLSEAEGRMIHRWAQRVGAILRKEGQISGSELKGYLEEGIRDAEKE